MVFDTSAIWNFGIPVKRFFYIPIEKTYDLSFAFPCINAYKFPHSVERCKHNQCIGLNGNRVAMFVSVV